MIGHLLMRYNKNGAKLRGCALKDGIQVQQNIAPDDRKRTENAFYTPCPLFFANATCLIFR